MSHVGTKRQTSVIRECTVCHFSHKTYSSTTAVYQLSEIFYSHKKQTKNSYEKVTDVHVCRTVSHVNSSFSPGLDTGTILRLVYGINWSCSSNNAGTKLWQQLTTTAHEPHFHSIRTAALAETAYEPHSPRHKFVMMFLAIFACCPLKFFNSIFFKGGAIYTSSILLSLTSMWRLIDTGANHLCFRMLAHISTTQNWYLVISIKDTENIIHMLQLWYVSCMYDCLHVKQGWLLY